MIYKISSSESPLVQFSDLSRICLTKKEESDMAALEKGGQSIFNVFEIPQYILLFFILSKVREYFNLLIVIFLLYLVYF